MALRKDTLITTKETRYFPAGGLHQLVPYVNWKVGSPIITLDGDFTVADLQWLIDHMSSKQPSSTSAVAITQSTGAAYSGVDEIQ